MGVLAELNVTTLADPRPPSRWKRQFLTGSEEWRSTDLHPTPSARAHDARGQGHAQDHHQHQQPSYQDAGPSLQSQTPKRKIQYTASASDPHTTLIRTDTTQQPPRPPHGSPLHSSSQHCHCLGLPTRISQIKDISGCDTDQHTHGLQIQRTTTLDS